jgi:hypothetical protein
LKRWRAHGDGGASNSEARRKVLEWQIVGVGRRELQRKWEVFFGEHVVKEGKSRLC